MSRVGNQLFSDICELSAIHANPNFAAMDRLQSSLQVLMDQVDEVADPVAINRVSLDYYIAQIDQQVSQQLNAIMHHEAFQALEANWRGLQYVLAENESGSNCQIDILDISKSELYEDFNESLDVKQSLLYQHVYTNEYDTPGGDPYTSIIMNYDFAPDNADLVLLQGLADVGRDAHCPCIGNAGPNFFQKESFLDLNAIDDLSEYFDKSDYIAWRAFRGCEESRYIGLTMPRFLLRLPYGPEQPCKQFHFAESTNTASDQLWGHASYAFAANLVKAFKSHGWTVNIRGPESGGKISGLPLPSLGTGFEGFHSQPVECLIPEARELALADLGLIPLCYYKNTDFACFFSANSIQQVKSYYDQTTQANMRINARLPYVYLVSRIGHYLKVLQRENIGANKSPKALEVELNRWLAHLVTKMPNPDPSLIAKHPLREGYVEVSPNLENPGFYNVQLFVKPHFQIEGVDVKLSLVAQLPGQGDDDKE